MAISTAKRAAKPPARKRSPTVQTAILVSERGLFKRLVEDDPEGGLLREHDVPLGRDHPRLTRAWAALGHVTVPSDAALKNLLMLLMEAVPEQRASVATPFSIDPPERALPKRTAAHPRGFRGTKNKPPKPAKPAARSLQAYFSSPADVIRILAVHSEEAFARAEEALSQLGLSPQDARWARRAAEVTSHVPLGFVRTLWSALRGAPLSMLHVAARHYVDLKLDEDEALRAAVARIFTSNGPSRARESIAWLGFLAEVQEVRRADTARVVALTNGAHAVQPPGLELMGNPESASWARRLELVLSAAVRGEPASYVQTGLQLADAFQPDFPFHARQDHGQKSAPQRAKPPREAPARDETRARLTTPRVSGGEFTLELGQRLAARLGTSWSRWGPLRLWEACGAHPCLAAAIAEIERSAASPTLLEHLLDLWLIPWSMSQRDDRIPMLAAHTKTLIDWALSLPESRVKLAFACFWETADGIPKARDLEAHLVPLLRLITRATSCSTHDFGAPVVAALSISLGPSLDDLNFNSSSSKQLTTLLGACRRANDAWLVGAGLRAILTVHPELGRRALLRHPAKLARVARELGILGHIWARATLRSVRERDLEALLEARAALREPHRTNPVPRALRRHLEGGRQLTEGQRRRHEQKVLSQADMVFLDDALREARRAIGVNGPSPDEAELHARRLLGWTQENRRPLTRLLSITKAAAKSDYVFRHTQARAWLSKHPRLLDKLELWKTGLRLEVDLPTLGDEAARVTLEIAQDPLEALRMGTYVGSCLGLGGGLAYSAAAAALDANKRVLYARDSEGRVVGRQLLAWADSDELVTFTPYPHAMLGELRAAFARYDALFAAALGIPQHDARGDDYRITGILSRGFWDDGAWFH